MDCEKDLELEWFWNAAYTGSGNRMGSDTLLDCEKCWVQIYCWSATPNVRYNALLELERNAQCEIQCTVGIGAQRPM